MSRRYGTRPEPRQVVVETRCDNCGRVEQGDPDGWVEVRWGHNDWGNDSIESGDNWDACSAPCLIALVKRAADDYEPKYRGQSTFSLWISGELDWETAKNFAPASALTPSEADTLRRAYFDGENDALDDVEPIITRLLDSAAPRGQGGS